MTSITKPQAALCDELLQDDTDPPEILDEHGLLKHWTPRVVERALAAELPVYLGYAPQAHQGGESDRRTPADWQRPKVMRWPAVACPGTHRQRVRAGSRRWLLRIRALLSWLLTPLLPSFRIPLGSQASTPTRLRLTAFYPSWLCHKG